MAFTDDHGYDDEDEDELRYGSLAKYCRKCGCGDLDWAWINNGFRLFETSTGKPHICDKQFTAKQDFKNTPIPE